jgi:hypothetical protein
VTLAIGTIGGCPICGRERRLYVVPGSQRRVCITCFQRRKLGGAHAVEVQPEG